jgi:hypothetical protein
VGRDAGPGGGRDAGRRGGLLLDERRRDLADADAVAEQRADHDRAVEQRRCLAEPVAGGGQGGSAAEAPFTKQGAEVFVRSYYLTLNAVIAAFPGTGEAWSLAHALSLYGVKGCECRYTQAFFVKHVHAGDRFIGEGYRIVSMRTVSAAGDSAVVTSTFSLSRVVTRNVAGRVVDVQDRIDRETDTFVVTHAGGSWRMTRQLIGKSDD